MGWSDVVVLGQKVCSDSVNSTTALSLIANTLQYCALMHCSKPCCQKLHHDLTNSPMSMLFVCRA